PPGVGFAQTVRRCCLPIQSCCPAERNGATVSLMPLTESAPAADQTGRATLASVRNAARVLRAFSRAGQELGITELARQLGLSKSTVHRLVTTLTAERLPEPGSTPGRHRPRLVLHAL